jgi:hypothetical protein
MGNPRRNPGATRLVSNFALRLQPSFMEEARKVAKAEGVATSSAK